MQDARCKIQDARFLAHPGRARHRHRHRHRSPPFRRLSLVTGRSTTHPPEQQTADNADRADKGQSPQITQIPHPAGRSSSSSKFSSPSRPRGLHRAIRSATLCESQWIPGALHPPAPWDSGRIQGDWQDREIPSHPRRAVRCHARAIRAANCRAQPLSARGLSFGEINGASTRALPGTLPAGAPLDNVGTERALHCGGCAPNIVKDGTPQKALSSTSRSH
jgi:hypothetical protein